MSIKVKAIRLGYYKHRRRKEGSLFVIKDEKEFSKVWMKKVDDDEFVKPDAEEEEDEAEVEPVVKAKGRSKAKSAESKSASNSEVI